MYILYIYTPIVNLRLYLILITSTVLFVFNTVINTLGKP